MSPDVSPVAVHMTDPARLRIAQRVAELEQCGEPGLSAEQMLHLLDNQFRCRGAHRLPQLAGIAALRYLASVTGKQIEVMSSGAAGDIEITLVGDDRTRTIYELKRKRVTTADIDRAVQKSATRTDRADSYLFITTNRIDPDVTEYAAVLYDATGTEFAVLDCVGFLRHFLHLFHRSRTAYLDAYQALVLAEPDSAVSLTLKEALLTLRQQAEAGE